MAKNKMRHPYGESLEEEWKWEFDGWGTLWTNILWIMMFIASYILIFIVIKQVNLFDEKLFQLIYLVFSLYFTLKLFRWIGHPIIRMKPNSKLNKSKRIK